MDDALAMGLVEAGCQLGRQREGAGGRQRTRVAQQVHQRSALDPFERHVGLAVVLAELVDQGDVGVLEVSDGRRLALEALARALLLHQVMTEDFESDRAVQRRIHRAEDDTHSAAADFRFDAKPAHQVAGGDSTRHCRHYKQSECFR